MANVNLIVKFETEEASEVFCERLSKNFVDADATKRWSKAGEWNHLVEINWSQEEWDEPSSMYVVNFAQRCADMAQEMVLDKDTGDWYFPTVNCEGEEPSDEN